MPSEEVAARVQLAHFIKSSLHCQYYLLVCPFRLKLVQDTNNKGNSQPQYQLQSWLPQKCICFLLTCTCFPWIWYTLHVSIPSNPKNPAAYLTLGFYMAIAMYQLGFIKKYWLDQSSILNLHNFILDTKNWIPVPNSENFVMKSGARIAMIFVCLLYISLAMVYWTLRKSDLTFPSNFLEKGGRLPWNWKWLWTTGVLVGRDMFFTGNSSENREEIADWILSGSDYPFSRIDAVVGFIVSVGQYYRLMLVTLCEMQFLVVSFTLRTVAKQFGTEVEQYCCRLKKGNSKNCEDGTHQHAFQNRLPWAEVQRKVEATSELASFINRVYGWNFGIFMADCLLFNSITINEIFLPEVFPDFWQIGGVTAYILGMVGVNYMCADTCAQVNNL